MESKNICKYMLTIGVLKSFNVKSEVVSEMLETFLEKNISIILQDSPIQRNATELFIDTNLVSCFGYVSTPYLGTILDKSIKNYPTEGLCTYIDHNNDSYTIQSPNEFIKSLNCAISDLEDKWKLILSYLWTKYGIEMFDKISNDTQLTDDEKFHILSLRNDNAIQE